jgi:hypothetical protein
MRSIHGYDGEAVLTGTPRRRGRPDPQQSTHLLGMRDSICTSSIKVTRVNALEQPSQRRGHQT